MCVVFFRSIYHFYGNGNICDATGKHRFVEVRMTLVNCDFGMTFITLELAVTFRSQDSLSAVQFAVHKVLAERFYY